ncbi:hypothetical protein B484DRAFT_400547 [Ochromonadaceae sp. CCMP2298]|nr:hypothetical protein B484DRAFT_400547 [Ochromonadaceae sp. CCMP2298]
MLKVQVQGQVWVQGQLLLVEADVVAQCKFMASFWVLAAHVTVTASESPIAAQAEWLAVGGGGGGEGTPPPPSTSPSASSASTASSSCVYVYSQSLPSLLLR